RDSSPPPAQSRRTRRAKKSEGRSTLGFARLRYYHRPPPPPRGRLPQPPRPPPALPPPARSVFGRASFTLSARPLSWVPFNPLIAACASALASISTKPKPRGSPLNLSRSTVARDTRP